MRGKLTTGAMAVGLTLTGSAAAEASIGISGPTSVSESGAATYTITRNAGVVGDATVTVVTSNGTAIAGEDYTAVNTGVTLGPGAVSPRSKTVTVQIASDALDEPDETFSVSLRDASGDNIGPSSSVTTTILDDDAAPTLSVGTPAPVDEGTALVFPISMSAASTREVRVAFATADGTAAAGEDYTATTGTLVIPAGGRSGTVTVPVSADVVDELDETLTLSLSAPVNATLGTASSATGTIRDDDTATVAVSGASVAEGPAGQTTPTSATVTLSTTSSRAVTVSYATADGSAVAPGDYTAAAGTVTIPAGQRTASIPLGVVGDGEVEPDESFSVVISSPVNTSVASGGGTTAITITNDDVPPPPPPPPVTPDPPPVTPDPPAPPAGGGDPLAGSAGAPAPSGGDAPVPEAGDGGTPVTGAGAPSTPKISLSRFSYRRATGSMRFVVRCPVGVGPCRGTLTVFNVPSRTSKVKALRKERQLGFKRFLLAPGGSVMVTLRLSRTSLGWLKSARSIRIAAFAVGSSQLGGGSTSRVTGTLRR